MSLMFLLSDHKKVCQKCTENKLQSAKVIHDHVCVKFALPCIECCHTHRWCRWWPHSLLEEADAQAILAKNVARSSESEILECNRNSKKGMSFCVYTQKPLSISIFFKINEIQEYFSFVINCK